MRLEFLSTCTQKCTFLSEEVREISRFFVAPPRLFAVPPPSEQLYAGKFKAFTHKFTHLSVHDVRENA